MKHLPDRLPDFGACIATVFSVSSQRMTEIRQMRPNLVCLSSQKMNTKKRIAAGSIQWFVLCLNSFRTFLWAGQNCYLIRLFIFLQPGLVTGLLCDGSGDDREIVFSSATLPKKT